MTTPLNIAVIGIGNMGGNHVRVLTDMPEVNLVAAADANPTRAEAIARRYPIKIYTDATDLLDQEQLDAVTICLPTSYHKDMALQVIERGLHLLVEKPISNSVQDGQAIIDAAEQAGVVLTVGHVERFNPAVIALRQRIAGGELGEVFQITTHRASPFPTHVRDVGVVVDLAVHDLDVMRYIIGGEIRRVYAEIDRRVHDSHEDQLVALLRFANGTIGKVMVNWLTPTKIRQLIATGARGMYEVNYLTQDLIFYENAAIDDPEWDTLRILRGVSEGPMTRYVVQKKEPLRAELEAFISAIVNNHPPMVTGQDGLIALWLAETIVHAGQQNQAIHLDGPLQPAAAQDL